MSAHPAARALEAALQFEVQKVRHAAAERIDRIDRRRAELFPHIDAGSVRSNPRLPGPIVPRRRAEQELKVLDVEREQRNEALVGAIEQLVATAQRADAAYRQGYHEDSPAARLVAPIEFKLSIEDSGPIPDPVRAVTP